MELKGMEKMKQARARLVLRHVFFGSAAITLKLIEDPTCPTAWTDGRSIGFNPEYINSLDIGTVESLICHEVMHCIFLHPLRENGREHMRWNMAGDYVANGAIKRAGMNVGENWLYHNEWSDGKMNTEMVYSKIPQQKGGQGNGKGQSRKGNGNSPDGNSGSNSNGSGNDPGKSQANGAGDPGNGWNVGEVRRPKGESGGELSESEAAQFAQEWRMTAVKAYNAAKACGKVPAGVDRIIEDIAVTKRDIEEVLREFVTKVFDCNYNWRRPNKSYIVRDLYVPSLQTDALPDIVFVLDTSGSVSQKQIDYFGAKLTSVLTEYNTTVHVLYCDTMVYHGGEYTQADLPLKLTPKGYGGTDFRPPFKWIKKHDIEPACLIYLTDMECSSFPEEPEYPVLWAVYNTWSRNHKWEAPFGEIVDVNPE